MESIRSNVPMTVDRSHMGSKSSGGGGGKGGELLTGGGVAAAGGADLEDDGGVDSGSSRGCACAAFRDDVRRGTPAWGELPVCELGVDGDDPDT